MGYNKEFYRSIIEMVTHEQVFHLEWNAKRKGFDYTLDNGEVGFYRV